MGFDGARYLNIDDLEAGARRRLPRFLYDFVARGTEDEVALRNNRQAFDRVKLYPRALVDVSARSQATTLFGTEIASPLIVAPTGSAGILWYEGEVDVARAASKANVPYCISTAAQTALEEIAEKAGGYPWFQLYMWPDRQLSIDIVDRVRRAGFKALVVTVDTVMSPNREYNIRNGFRVPMRLTRRNIVDALRHPGWLRTVILRYMMTSGMPGFVNDPAVVRAKKKGLGFVRDKNETCSWDDINFLRGLWDGPLIIKGILHPDDAKRAVGLGADGIVVSNHGGRNLDSSPAPLDMLPRVADAVAGRATVLFDSGIRRGSDVVKALALGAQAVLIGRAMLWGVTVGGEAGAAHALALIKKEIDTVSGYVGCPRTGDLSRANLVCYDAVRERLIADGDEANRLRIIASQ